MFGPHGFAGVGGERADVLSAVAWRPLLLGAFMAGALTTVVGANSPVQARMQASEGAGESAVAGTVLQQPREYGEGPFEGAGLLDRASDRLDGIPDAGHEGTVVRPAQTGVVVSDEGTARTVLSATARTVLSATAGTSPCAGCPPPEEAAWL